MDTRGNWINTASFNSLFYTKEETIESVKTNFDFRRNYTAEGKTIVIDDTYTENVLIQDHTNPLNENKTDRKIHISIDSNMKCGSKVDFENKKWLVVSDIKNVDDAYHSAQIQKCNYTLPFQTNSSTIINEPCIVEIPTFTSAGENKNSIITIPNTVRVITIQYNFNTAKLDTGKRLYIDSLIEKPKVYKITSNIDRITKMQGDYGLLTFVCEEDATVSSTDRPDLKIADYVSETPVPPLSSGSAYITDIEGAVYTSSVALKVGGLKKPFVSLFKDSTGNIVNATPLWSLTNIPDILIDKINLTYDLAYPTRCYLQVHDDDSLIGQEFKLDLIDTDTKYVDFSITCKVVSLI